MSEKKSKKEWMEQIKAKLKSFKFPKLKADFQKLKLPKIKIPNKWTRISLGRKQKVKQFQSTALVPVKQKKRIWKFSKRQTVLGAAVALGALALIYLSGVLYFDFHFYSGTTIDGNQVGGCTATAAAEKIDNNLAEYRLTLLGRDTEDVINFSEIGGAYDYDLASYSDQQTFTDNVIKEYLSKQNQFLWPFQAFIAKEDKQFILNDSFDVEKLDNLIDSLNCMTAEQVEAQPAYLTFENGQYTIVPEVQGTVLDRQTLLEAIISAFQQKQDTLDLSEIYIQPALKSDDAGLIAAMNHGNAVKEMDFVLDDGVRLIQIPKEDIQSLLTIENNTVKVNWEQAVAYAANLKRLNPAGTAQSVNAYLEYQDDNGYVIVPETQGQMLSNESFATILSAAVDAENPVLDASGVYTQADLKSDDTALIAARDEANAILNTAVTIQNDYYSVTPSKEDIASMINTEGTEVSIDRNAVRSWVNNHEADGFSHSGISRTITTASNEKITLAGGTYGNQIDVDGETEQLIADLTNHETKTREPVYSYEEWGSKSENGGIGYTFLDIDLDAQTVYLVKDGQLVYSTSMVSGDPTTGHETPTGIYYNCWRTTEPEVKRYNIDVLYWMQIDDQADFGIHDAGWRDLFGGSLYEGDGTGGGIDISRDAAAYLYENTKEGIPIIIH